MTPPLVPVIVLLSGESRGESRRLSGDVLRIGTAEEAEVMLPAKRNGALADFHATLRRDEEGYRLVATPPHPVWVNGRPADSVILESGDLIELGEHGPLLRFRLYPAGGGIFKSLRESLADSYQAARSGSSTAIGRTTLFVRGVVHEFLTQVSPLSRVATLATVLLLLVAVVFLSLRGQRLEERLQTETLQVEGLQALLDSAEETRISTDDLELLRQELEQRIASAAERLDYLEERAGAAQRTVAEASQSVVFLQGSYGFREPESGLPLRIALAPDGRPLADARGNPSFSTQGVGPVVEAFFTGTGFVAHSDGLILTNRHLALPWDFDDAAQQVISQGLEPFMVRFVGFVAGNPEPFEVELAASTEEADLAVLRCSSIADSLPSLPLSTELPDVGEEVLVLGFPTGIQAMMARADQSFLDTVAGKRLDFWQIAERLAEAGQIGPLATRGIVGQVTPSTVVYDAETTSGGSGGPVLNLEGRVVAINSAILRQFDGSNLGVPSRLAVALLDQAALEPATTPEPGD